MRTYMRRRTRLAAIVKVTKEIEETAMPRRLMSRTIDGGAAIVYSVKNFEDSMFRSELKSKAIHTK